MSAERDHMSDGDWLNWQLEAAILLSDSLASTEEEKQQIVEWVKGLEELRAFTSREMLVMLVNKMIEEDEKTIQ